MLNLSYFKSFLNFLKKNKLYTAITVLGLSISLMFVIILSVYLEQELSVDRFHAKKDRVYRLANDNHSMFALPVGSMLADKFPQLISFTRIFKYEGILNAHSRPKVSGEILLADSSFFNMFSYSLIKGNPETCLQRHNAIVLSKSMAIRMFNELPPPGEPVELDGESFVLTGIMNDFPENTIYRNYQAIANINALEPLWGAKGLMTSFDNNSFNIFFLASPNSNTGTLESQVLEFFHNENYWLYSKGFAEKVVFEPLSDVYFSDRGSHFIAHGEKQLTMILAGATLFILILSLINYINLTIAQAGFRSNEMAIRKLNGATRGNLILHMLAESVVLCLIAFIMAFFMAGALQPAFNQIMSANIDITAQWNISHWIYSLIILITIGVFSGIFPALHITKINAIDVVKGEFQLKTKTRYSKILIAFQLMIVIGLLTSTIFVFMQYNYLKNFNVGFNHENILYFDNNHLSGSQIHTFKTEAERISSVKAVSLAAGTPIDGGNNHSFDYNGKPIGIQYFKADSTFIDLMGFKVRPTGTAYSDKAVIINKAAIEAFELDSLPVECPFYSGTKSVFGVIDNFSYRGLYNPVGPIMIELTRLEEPWHIIVGLKPGWTKQTIQQMEKIYDEISGGVPFEYTFMDQKVETWYKKERNSSRLVMYFSLLAIIISIMGIYAMSLYFIRQKQKEIAVRKINGAEPLGLLGFLSLGYIKLVGIAFIIITPVAIYGLTEWLNQFAYKIELTAWPFIVSGVITLFVAFVTISGHIWYAANQNPVKRLRYE